MALQCTGTSCNLEATDMVRCMCCTFEAEETQMEITREILSQWYSDFSQYFAQYTTKYKSKFNMWNTNGVRTETNNYSLHHTIAM